jgi:ABC-2 type transport system permease protein
MMVRLAQGFGPGESIHLYLSILVEIISSAALLWIAARLYKNGLLQFGHSIRLRTIFTWLKMK